MREIAEKSADGDYLYRGEPKHYCRVSSSLYRRIRREGLEDIDIERAQEEDLREARQFVVQTYSDGDLLSQLQHYGSNTNLIDFTTDYLIALFFACNGEHKEDGRVILLNRSSYPLLRPSSPENRVIAQKSVFVRPPEGTVNADKTICVPQNLKKPILRYLSQYHGARLQTIYNDLHGFIRHRQGHSSSYMVFYGALTLAKKGKYEEAIAGFNNAIELNPQLTAAYNNLGKVYEENGELDRAIENYDKAIELNPNLAAGYYNRGVAYKRKGDLDRAVEDYTRAISLNPSYFQAYNNRGNAYSDQGKHDFAVQDFDKAIELNPKYASAYNNRGSVYLCQGNHDLAIQDFDRAIELNSRFASAYNNRGTALASKGELDRAVQDFSRAIELSPRSVAAYMNRSSAYREKGDYDLAAQDRNKAVELVVEQNSTGE